MSRLTSMVEKWNNSGDVPRIERDMALEELRRIYDELLDYEPIPQDTNTPEVVVPVAVDAVASSAVVEESVAVAAPVVDSDIFDDALDIDALLGLSGTDSIEEAEAVVPAPEPVIEPIAEPQVVAEPEPEVVPEPEVAPEVTPEPEVVPESEVTLEPEEVVVATDVAAEPEVDASAERSATGGLFDIDDIPVRTRSGRRMISLYDAPTKPINAVEESVEVVAEESVAAPTTIVVEPAPTPQPVVAPQEEAPQRLGDVIAKNVTTLADKMAEEQPTAAYNRITDIRKAIGLNDKFLMIRDLFDGDAKLYEQTITRLNEFDDLDECMIYIVENFRWNPDSEGAKLLVSLIERKLS